MPTVFSHPAAPIGAVPGSRSRLRDPRVVVIGMVLTVVPDADVIGFGLGVAYGDLLGHRGLTHSLPFALVLGGLVAWPVARRFGAAFRVLWLYFTLCVASHGVLDALTNGGLGVAFFSPFSNERYFFEYRPLQVSAISVQRFFAGDWTGLLAVEFQWIWLPMLGLGAAGLALWRFVISTRPARVKLTDGD